MNIREILQIELWSKRTTWKIFVLLIAIGVLAIFGWTAWLHYQYHWLTNGERKVAMAALVQIDALQDSTSLNDKEFDARTKQAEEKIEVAQRVARTDRDKNVAVALAEYLGMVSMGRDNLRMPRLIQQRHNASKGFVSDWESTDSEAEATTRLMRALMHRALD